MPAEHHNSKGLSTEDLDRLRLARLARHGAREWLWHHSAVDRFRDCGRASHGDRVSVLLGTKNGVLRAGAAGLITCGSVWACPVCAAKIQAGRVDSLARINDAAYKKGDVVFATFTMRHTKEDALSDLWDGLGSAWKRLVSGRKWLEIKDRFSIYGWARAVEVTYGRNGWHVHCHVAIYLDGKGTSDTVAELRTALYTRWSAALESEGYTSDEQGFDIRRSYNSSGLAKYLGKGLAFELGSQNTKNTKVKRTFSPLLFLESLSTGEVMPGYSAASMAALWKEYEAACRGRRQLTFSHRLRDHLPIGEDKTDEELATEPEMDDAKVVMVFRRKTWWDLATSGLTCALYAALERDGLPGGVAFCERWEIEWIHPGVAAPVRKL